MLNALRRWFHPHAEPDPKLVVAYDRVDTETQALKVAIGEAKQRGTFNRFRESMVTAADKDAARIRRRNP